MPVTIYVRSADLSAPADASPRLTFDGSRVVIGRAASCDVRLPDPSVTLRHASIRADGPAYVAVDEGSTNGTFIGGVRLAPNAPRALKSGDLLRVGRVWLEIRLDQAPVTSELGPATRDMALALVSQAMRRLGSDVTSKIHVVEGRDAGLVLTLAEEGRAYLAGRSNTCDIALLDPDVSREHAQFVRRAGVVLVRDLGSKNGVTVAGGEKLPEAKDVPWPRGAVLRIGKTGLALEEPVLDALAELESSADERLAPEDVPPPPTAALPIEGTTPGAASPAAARPAAPMAESPATKGSGRTPRPERGGWSAADFAVMVAAMAVLALSVAGLVWLLRG